MTKVLNRFQTIASCRKRSWRGLTTNGFQNIAAHTEINSKANKVFVTQTYTRKAPESDWNHILVTNIIQKLSNKTKADRLFYTEKVWRWS